MECVARATADVVIAFAGVGKSYRSWTGREVRALTDFSLDIAKGEVFGLAGPNGAGKSTLISLLLGFLAPSEGETRIDGVDPRAFVQRNGVGYLSELINIPPSWRLTAALERYAILSGVPQSELSGRVEAAIVQLGLDEHRGKRVRQLSKGNLQRVGLAQALLAESPLVVLDEPTHGLDPVWTGRFRDIVDQLRRPDRTILIASHNLDELSRLADRVGIIDRGRLVRVVDVRATERQVTEGAAYRIVLTRGQELVATQFPMARSLGRGEFEMSDVSLDDINRGLVQLIAAGAQVNALYPVHSELEQQFREAVGRRATDG
ncbi:MAG: ABC transporter ATP-binding protein [Gemmatimonadota bacterium]|nr:ABC transporter ATP-binding protein [Gemmatimonadota bacterium]